MGDVSVWFFDGRLSLVRDICGVCEAVRVRTTERTTRAPLANACGDRCWAAVGRNRGPLFGCYLSDHPGPDGACLLGPALGREGTDEEADLHFGPGLGPTGDQVWADWTQLFCDV